MGADPTVPRERGAGQELLAAHAKQAWFAGFIGAAALDRGRLQP